MHQRAAFSSLALIAALSAGVAAAWEPSAGSVLLTLIEQVEVPAREAGVLAALDLKEGARVMKGEALGRIDDADVRLTASKARAELAIAQQKAANEADIKFARKSQAVAVAELNRAEESIRKFAKAISATEMDYLRLAAQKTEAQIEQADNQQKVAQAQLKLAEVEVAIADNAVARRQIVAPLDGVVVQIKRRAGEWVEPGMSVIRLVRIDRLRAEGFLSAKDLKGPLVGAEAVLTIDLPGRPKARYPGRVAFVSPEVDPVNNQVRFWAEIENSDLTLRPGLSGTLTLGK